MFRFLLLLFAYVALLPWPARADELLYGYEGNVLPYDDGWVVSDCTWPCSQRVENGYFVLQWVEAADHVQFRHHITTPPNRTPSRCGSNSAFAPTTNFRGTPSPVTQDSWWTFPASNRF